MIILVTGANGYLGSFIIRALVEANHKIIILKRSTSKMGRIIDLVSQCEVYDLNVTPLENIFEGQPIDVILHLATCYARAGEDPGRAIEANLSLPVRLMHCGFTYGVGCFVHADTVLEPRLNAYSLTKSYFRDWMKYIAPPNMRCINVGLEHFYGPGDDTSKFVSWVIHGLLQGTAQLDLTSGNQYRDFVYIGDVVEAFMRILDNCLKVEPGFLQYHVGTGKPVTVRSVVELIKELSGNRSTILNYGARPSRMDETSTRPMDLSEIERLGWKARYSLVDGLKRTIEADQQLLKESIK